MRRVKDKVVTFLNKGIANLQKKLRYAATFFFVLLVIAVLYKYFFPQQWFFTITAKTNVVDLVTPKNEETKWRLQEVIICSRSDLILSDPTIIPRRSKESYCGSKSWAEYSFQDSETVLKLTGEIKIHLESQIDGSLRASLKRASTHAGEESEHANKTSAFLSFTNGMSDIDLIQNNSLKINIFWPEALTDQNSNYIFPFMGSATIGKDINWASTKMLESGEIQVYTADMIDKRQLIDERTLLAGDQLSLVDTDNDVSTAPKGFIRFLTSDNDHLLEVVAFGTADFIRVDRYGNSGYDFKPGFWSQLFHDPWLIALFSILIAIISSTEGLIILFGKEESGS